jgi:hypothetical protein
MHLVHLLTVSLASDFECFQLCRTGHVGVHRSLHRSPEFSHSVDAFVWYPQFGLDWIE